MSNETPQLENGYCRIATELLEAICRADFTKREYKIVLTLIRQTYGYGKKTDDISLSRISNICGLDSANVSRTISGLVDRGVLLKQQGRYGHLIGIAKDYRKWKGCQNGKVAKMAIGGCQNGNLGVAKLATTIDNLTKDNTNKEKTEIQEISAFDDLVLKAWAKHCPTLSQPNRRLWNKSAAKAGLDKAVKLDTEKHSNPEMWEWLFSHIRSNNHWMGGNERGWKISLPWILDAANKSKRFMQVLDYAREQHAAKTVKITGAA